MQHILKFIYSIIICEKVNSTFRLISFLVLQPGDIKLPITVMVLWVMVMNSSALWCLQTKLQWYIMSTVTVEM